MAKRGGFPGGMPGNMNNLMKQAQRMQRQMEEKQKELEEKQYSASAGGGAVNRRSVLHFISSICRKNRSGTCPARFWKPSRMCVTARSAAH